MALLLGLLAGLSATSAFLGPVAAPRRAAPLFVIETAPGPTEQEIFSEATSISGALAELWSVLANPPPPGDFRAMYFPQCEGLKRPSVWKSTSESGADNSSRSHLSARTRPTWLGRAARNRHRHAVEQASRRWREGNDSP